MGAVNCTLFTSAFNLQSGPMSELQAASASNSKVCSNARAVGCKGLVGVSKSVCAARCVPLSRYDIVPAQVNRALMLPASCSLQALTLDPAAKSSRPLAQVSIRACQNSRLGQLAVSSRRTRELAAAEAPPGCCNSCRVPDLELRCHECVSFVDTVLAGRARGLKALAQWHTAVNTSSALAEPGCCSIAAAEPVHGARLGGCAAASGNGRIRGINARYDRSVFEA